MPRLVLLVVLGALPALAGAAWAQAVPAEPAAPEAARWGAWGLIGLGVLFFLMALMPARTSGERAEAGRDRSLLRTLQRRIETETTGWRRLQWPILGLFFVAVGLAALLGWL